MNEIHLRKQQILDLTNFATETVTLVMFQFNH